MIREFARSGVSFKFPANWEVEDEAEGTDWVFTLQTPGSGMMLITYRDDGPSPAAMADETLEALRDDYDSLDSEIALEQLAGRVAMGYDIDFLTQVTPVTAKLRALETSAGTLMIFWQVGEKDREHYEPLLNAVMASLAVVD